MSDALPLFVYGTLQDADVLKRVTGLDLAALAPQAATLPGYAVERVEGASYPILVEQVDRLARGLLLPPPDEATLDRLIAYETSAYRLTALAVIGPSGPCAAVIFLPTDRLVSSGEPWRLADWQETHKARFLAALVREAPL